MSKPRHTKKTKQAQQKIDPVKFEESMGFLTAAENHMLGASRVKQFGIILLFCFLLYGLGIKNQFTYDDHSYIENNLQIRSLEQVFQVFSQTSSEHGEMLRSLIYRPFSYFFQWLVGNIGGYTPESFHVANILLYGANVFLFLQILRIVLPGSLALAVAGIFMVHPLHVEVVASAVGITELLAALFGLLCLLAVIQIESRIVACSVATLSLFLALLSKETAVVFIPIVMIVLLKLPKREAFFRFLPFVAVGALYFVLRHRATGSLFMNPAISLAFLDNPLFYSSPGERIINSVWLTARYLFVIIFPFRLAADYSFNALPLIASIGDGRLWISIVFHLTMVAISIYAWRSRSYLFLAALLICYVALVPINNLLAPSGAIFADRFAYVASAGLLLAVGTVFRELQVRNRLNLRLIQAGFLIVFVGFAILSVLQTTSWASDLVLFQSVAKKYPTNAKAHYNVATLLFDQGNISEALEHSKSALEIYPDYVDAAIVLARAYSKKGDAESAIAVLKKLDRQKIRLTPELYESLGVAYTDKGNHDLALETYAEAMKFYPRYFNFYHNSGLIYMSREDYFRARGSFESALRVGDHPDTRFALGYIEVVNGRFDIARMHLTKASTSEKFGRESETFLAYCDVKLGYFDEAIQRTRMWTQLNDDMKLIGTYARLKSETDVSTEELEFVTSRGCDAFKFSELCDAVKYMAQEGTNNGK